ncbi:isoprenylcysteine carboxyl methyltransferase family protein [Thalassobacillus sp. C254]|uniref:isoprenylcysteine carboxyl methyltransferase family protein n=1 Tax=Thalassobacillus sp. C254 TaxID=1225341 RepID=UPI000A4F32F3|nr:isoprenylcysteine carboxylmethyltransferase family protein [Thalassobacillus sp. C254]
MVFFSILVAIVIIQRLIELLYAKRNEKWMKAEGAVEYGSKHYPFIVLLHVLFFVSILIEGTINEGQTGPGWFFFFLLFIAAQVMRVWALASLGKFWNTKIIVLPGENKVAKGPYRWVKHPNYIVVATEIAALPLIFGAYFTAIVFTILNALLLLVVRIPAEEKALTALKQEQAERKVSVSRE